MAASADNNLLATALLERDRNDEVLWTWVYPALADGLREVLTRNAEEAGLLAADLAEPTTTFLRIGNVWCYLTSSPVAALESAAGVPDTVAITSVVLTKEFNPEKYLALSDRFVREFAAGGDATAVLKLYLKVTLTGGCKGFKSAEHTQRQAFMQGSVKSVVKTLGLETILVYTAILIKKRVAVFCPDPSTLLAFVRTLPQLVLARQDWSILRPWLHLTETELGDLAEARTYVAGFTEPEIENREDLYDVFVNVADGTVRVASQAKDDFGLGKVHKEIATFLLSAADDADLSDQDVLRELATRTKDLKAGLMKLATPDEADADRLIVQAESIKGRKMQPSMQRFLLNLAAAENVLAM